MKQGLVKIAKWLMVVLFMSYYFSTTLFYHTHHFQWGTVTHSHPYIPFEGFAFPYGRTVRDDRFVVGNRFVDRCRSGSSFRKDDRYADLCFLFAVRFAPSFAWHFAQGPSCFHLRVIYRQVFVSHGFSGNSFRRGKSVCFL